MFLLLYKKLDLDSNQLTTLPEPILELKNLQELHLSGNGLRTPSESLFELSDLKTILVSGNPLEKNAKKILKELENRGVSVSK
ncbi:MAG: hypothetical protein GF329_11600 [Candidatus Lokiarchaeota archaeon]|nr:hypothetical protein [Candidatus Lokiarchaeota archaeon]